MKTTKVIYYKNELEDEFSDSNITKRVIDESYSYLGGVTRKIGRVVLYYCLARPIAFLFLKIHYGHRVVNKGVLKESKGKKYYLYGNHTNQFADPFIPTVIDINRDTYVIVHPDNVSMPVLGPLVPSLGALPLPDTLDAAKNFSKALKTLSDKNKTVVIYPEAHIWPFYTKIRPFKNNSFGYPIQFDADVYSFTNTYVKRRFRKTPRIVTYVDGPFRADKNLSKQEQKESLRNMVYETMCERSKNNNVEIIKYIKKEDD